MDERIQAALTIAEEDGMVDGAHHKQWVIDQMLQALLGEDGYAAWLQEYNDYAAANDYAPWDEGIAP